MTDAAGAIASGRRTDARRNRERILAAAHLAFADPDVSMAEIARRSGVGSATLYRNFPDRQALLETLYRDEIDAMCEAAVTSAGDTAWNRLEAWLRRFYHYVTDKRVLAGELLKHVSSDSAVFEAGYSRITAAATPLVNEARAAGELRDGLSLDQILALIASVARLDGEPAFRQPVLDAALAGLRAGPG